jgi:murein DD-endopeptidase MepM/ murein hydrolase activator NlpD
MGRGLVHPTDQMHSANPPAVPGVLEALADDLASHGYDLDRLVAGLVSSRVYQLAGTKQGDDGEPGDRHFARARLRPLTPQQFAFSLVLAAGDGAYDAGGEPRTLPRRYREAEARAARAAEARARAERARARAEEAAARQAIPQPEPHQAALPEARPPGGGQRAGRAMPVAGQVLRDYGAGGEGGRSRGLTFQAAPGARVVSPCGGRVAFAAPFRSYGLLLIVDCGGGYHVVLAGLDRLDAAPGQKVLAGEPVGQLDAEGRERPTLYLELRRDGRPVDPKGWLSARS